METGYRFETVELSTIDTALLLAGVLFCQSYFTGTDRDRGGDPRLADRSTGASTGTWARPRTPLVSMGWKPESGFIAPTGTATTRR